MHAELSRAPHCRVALFLVLFVLFAPNVGAQTSVLKTGAGAVAHNMCSVTFVSGLAEKVTYDELVGALIGWAKFLARYRVDPVSKAVDASLLFAHARAVFTPGHGCRLVYGEGGVTGIGRPQVGAQSLLSSVLVFF